MGRPHGHVRVSSRNPRAAGICDRCGFAYNHERLQWQVQWAGERLNNLRILVCDRCYDEPQEQLRARILSPDPIPIMNARPEPFTETGVSYQETQYVTDEDGLTTIETEDGFSLIMENQPTGN